MRQSHCVSVRFSGSELRTHDHYPPTTPFVRWGVFGKPPPCCGLQDPRLTPIPYTIRLFLLIRYSLTHQCLPYPQSTNKQANVAPNECPVRLTSEKCVSPANSSNVSNTLRFISIGVPPIQKRYGDVSLVVVFRHSQRVDCSYRRQDMLHRAYLVSYSPH